MARLLLGLLVTGMFTLTGYYAFSTIGHPDQAPTIEVSTHKCCHESTGERCCSESGDCTGKCHQIGDGKCCKDAAAAEGKCCQDKEAGKCCKDKEAEASTKDNEDKE